MLKSRPYNHLLKPLAVAVCCISGNAALADTSNFSIEEVVVTAQRKSENLQSVPIAVTAFSSNDLQQLQANDIGDIQNSVPNLTLHVGDAANAVVYIRGVGQVDSLAFADPGVGIYLDDIYLGRAQGAFLDVFDVQRIEVLRGPQGTLYGRNTIGGAVKFVSTPPSDELSASVEATVGNYQRQELKATVSGPLSDNLRGKLSIAQMTREGYSDNSFDGNDDGDKDAFAWRGSLDYQVTDNLSAQLSVDSSKDRPDSSRTPARATPVFGTSASSDPFEVAADFNDKNDLEVAGVALTVDLDISDNLSLKSISSYRQMDYQANLDLDATASPIFGIFVDEDQQQFSQEFQLNYDNGADINWVLGLYYFHEEDETESGVFGPAIAFVSDSLNDQDNVSYAVYSQVNMQLTENTSMSAGLRYTREEKDFKRRQEFFAASASFPVQLGQGFVATDLDVNDDWSSVSPKLGIEHQVNETVMTYASVSKGFKSGGFDGRSNDAFGAKPYDQETLIAYEVGIKSQWLEQRLQVNAALFYNDYEDLQLSSFVADSNNSFAALFTNAGEANISGAEVELTALFTEQFSIDINLGYMHAEYDEYIGPGGDDISSQRDLVNTPEFTARIAPQYTLNLGNQGELVFLLDWSYRSKTYPTVSSSEQLAQSGYSVLNANLSYFSADGHWRVSIGGKNLSDKEYITHGFDLSDSLGYQLAYYGTPRTYALSVNYQF